MKPEPLENSLESQTSLHDALATALYEAARVHLPGMRLRTDYADGDPDLEAGFYILRNTA